MSLAKEKYNEISLFFHTTSKKKEINEKQNTVKQENSKYINSSNDIRKNIVNDNINYDNDIVKDEQRSNIDTQKFLKANDNINKGMSSSGWSYMSPDKWSVPQQRPPVCLVDKKTNVSSVVDKGTPINALKWPN